MIFRPLNILLKDFYGRNVKKIWNIIALIILILSFFLYFYDDVELYQDYETDPIQINYDRFVDFVNPFPTPHNVNKYSFKLNTSLIIDVSGSMTKTDPQQLALESAKLFVDLLNEGSYCSIILFNHDISLFDPFELISTEKEKEIKNKLKYHLGFGYGGGTNIDLAIEKGYNEFINHRNSLQNKDEFKDVIIFFTDAIANYVRDMKNTLKNENINLFPIGFGDAYNTQIFQYLSYESPYFVKKPEDLISTYTDIFSKIYNTKSYEPKNTSKGFEISSDKNIPQINLIAVYDDTKNLVVKLFRGDDEIDIFNDKNIYFGKERRYIVIKLKNNSWDKKFYFKSSPSPKSLICIPLYNFHIKVDFSDFDKNTKEVQVKSISVVDNSGNIIKDQSVKFYVILDDPQKRVKFDLDKKISDGEYSGSFKFEKAGNYKFFFVAESNEYKLESDPYFFEFSEKTNISILNSPYKVDGIKKGLKLQIPIIFNNTSYFGNVGEKFKVEELEKINGLRLDKKSLHLSNNVNKDYFTILVKKDKFPFIKGCKSGENVYKLNLIGDNNNFQYEVTLNVKKMSFFEYIFPFVILLIGVILSFKIFRELNNTPFFHPSITMIKYVDGIIDFRRISHPGAKWPFGKNEIKISSQYSLVPVKGNNFTLEIVKKTKKKNEKERDEEENIIDKYLRVESQFLYDGTTIIYFTKKRSFNLSEISSKFDKIIKRLRTRYGANVELKIEDI